MRNLLLIAALVLVAASCRAQEAPLPQCEWCGVSEAPRNLKSAMVIASTSEPGERLVLTGRVLQSDARTPAANVILYAYHTNAEGVYPRRGDERGNARRHGYLRGWLRTDAQGRYRIDTIRPGTYPSRTDPAHVHVVMGAPGKTEQYIDDFVFSDDPLVDVRYRNRVRNRGGSGITTLTKRDGTWYGTRDIVLPR
jgi:protocatechuate 3,4-dioxygenase, beta subunit